MKALASGGFDEALPALLEAATRYDRERVDPKTLDRPDAERVARLLSGGRVGATPNVPRDIFAETRRIAVAGLAEIDTPVTAEPLVQIATEDLDDLVRGAAMGALAKRHWRQGLSAIAAGLGDESAELRKTASDALTRLITRQRDATSRALIERAIARQCTQLGGATSTAVDDCLARARALVDKLDEIARSPRPLADESVFE